ncbi:MAG: glycine zipper family protein [Pseudomonadota bacterium]
MTFPAFRRYLAVPIALAGLLAGCATTGPASGGARPVLYPNATMNRVGDAQAQAEVAACTARAQAAGLTPLEGNNQVARSAGEGAAVAGVASAVGALVFGRGGEGVLRAGAQGAAIGGSAGAVSGAFRGNERPNLVYRSFVQRCLSEKGFDVIGWN